MRQLKTKTLLFARAAMTAAVVLPFGTAVAQVTPATDSSATQEIVVTGSRIPTPNLRSGSPIATVSQQQFKDIGASDTIDALNELPQVSVGNGFNNTPNPLDGGGYTTVDLRNLGTSRTLVLEDGRRLMPGDPFDANQAVDIDQIPTFLIDRVDVVTGGASAVYGSDAVAGVVNFIMKRNLDGFRIDIQEGVDQHDNGDAAVQGAEKAFGLNPTHGSIWDGGTTNVSLALGRNFKDGDGNVTAYLTYRHAEPISQGSRDFSQCPISLDSGAIACTGASVSNFFYSPTDGNVYSVTGKAPNNILTLNRSQATTPPQYFDSPPFNYLARADERYTGGFFAHDRLRSWADVYADFSFMDDRSVEKVSPSGLEETAFNVNCDNPLLSAQQQSVICAPGGVVDGQGTLYIGRRDVEAGPRVYEFDHQSYKIDIGSRGELGQGWSYDAYAQLGRTDYSSKDEHDISNARAQNALLVGGTAANPVCLSGAPCVPYNIFSDGGVTPAALQYVSALGTITGDTQEQIVSANVTGNLGRYGVKSPLATEGVGVNLGAEYRREHLNLTPDDEETSGDLAGNGGGYPAVQGSFDVKEVFGEFRVPLVQDLPFAKDLTFDGSIRYSDYSTAGGTIPYKLALEWAPVSGVLVRGSLQRAVRAPNASELFAPQTITASSSVAVDPCAPTQNSSGAYVPASATAAACARTGVTAAQYGNGVSPAAGGTSAILQCPTLQCAVTFGGNSALRPEASNTYSFGAVFTPARLIRGLNVSVDYFHIDIRGAVETTPASVVLSSCLNSNEECGLIHRSPAGTLFGENLATAGYIVGTLANIGVLKTDGVDVVATYQLNLNDVGLGDVGRVTFGLNGTFTDHLKQEPFPGEGSYDCAGLFGSTCQAPTPKWRHQFRVTYASPLNFTVSAQWRFTSATKLDNNQSNPLLSAGFIDQGDARIGSYSYFDLSGTWTLKRNLVLRAGVNNLFDKDPPLIEAAITGTGSANTFSNFDLVGRNIFVGLSADF